jgi:limonene-1,2-epoxide hydrolase
VPTDIAGHGAERCVRALLAAVASRDVRRLDDVLAVDVTWQNVPHEPVAGRAAVVALLGELMTWSDRVEWEVVSAAYEAGRGWVERVDRFDVDGVEYAVRCNGVFEVDGAGRLRAVRDYVDLGEWRARVAPALATRRAASPLSVVARHVAAVERRDVVAMAADYRHDAILERPGRRIAGWRELLDYFETVPARLDGLRLRFDAPFAEEQGASVGVRWAIESADARAPVASGHDTFTVESGRIATQVVHLDGADF